MEKRIFAILSLIALALLMIAPFMGGADAVDEPEPLFAEENTEAVQKTHRASVGVFTTTSTVTAYCPCSICCGTYSAEHPCNAGTDFNQRTASGTIPTAHRTIAVDPDVIPIGSYVMIGKSVYIAEDTGSGVTGNHIDIYMSTHEEAQEFGVQELEVTVYTPEHFSQEE